MANFARPPVTSDFNYPDPPPGQPKQAAPTYAWERWFQAITNFLSAPQIKQATPATSISTGVQDSITYDQNFLYICVRPNVWKRVSLSSF